VLQRTAAIFLISALTVQAAEEEPAQPVLRAQAASATVWMAHDDSAVDRFNENAGVSRRMVNALVQGVTGEKDVGKAWGKLVKPTDRIGIKVNASGGKTFSTRPGVVRAVIEGLEQAGVKPANVIVWDRDSSELKDAGFDPQYLGVKVRAIDPPKGWDRSALFAAPTLGRLIWGDALFVEKNRKGLGKQTFDADQLSSSSYYSSILTKDVTRIINIGRLADDAGCGIAGVFYNLCVKNVDNWRRYVSVDQPVSESIPEIYVSEHIAPKVALHILDGLVAQFAGAPEPNPNYAYSHATLYASTDPVALDSLGLRKIDEWRKMAKLPSIAPRANWLKTAEALGLGESSESRLKLVPVFE
jgi:uncharacterized protein (DUF362 family)